MASKGLTRTGARRSGDDYQDIVALEEMVNWLSSPSLYQAIYVEAEDAGYLDDLKVILADGSAIFKPVKFATHPNDPKEEWTWERLTTPHMGKTGKRLSSLLEKWGASLRQVTAKYSIKKAFLVSNRPPSSSFRLAMKDGNRIDLNLISDVD